MARKGCTKVIYKGTFVSEQSLFIQYLEFEPLRNYRKSPLLSASDLSRLPYSKSDQIEDTDVDSFK